MAQRCPQCDTLRSERSFLKPNGEPRRICAPCKYRPDRVRVRTWRAKRTDFLRERKAICFVVKHLQAENQPFVYLMKVDPDLYKIGFSRNVDKRLRQLTVTSSLPVQLIAVAPGGRQLEQDLHRQFRSLQIGNEWFNDRRKTIIPVFAALPNAAVFLPGYIKQDAPDVHQVI